MNVYDSLFIPLSDHTRVSLGGWGESVVKTALSRSGYQVEFSPYGCAGDLHAKHPQTGELWVIEVKSARCGLDGTYRFTLWKQGHTSHLKSDIVILLPVMQSGRCVPFVLPVSLVACRTSLAIASCPDTYAGRFASYRQSMSSMSLEGVL